MRVVLATLYPNRGGSTQVLLAAANALRAEHEVIVRAPLNGADSRNPRHVPLAPLAGWRAKLAAVPRLSVLVIAEWRWLRRLRPDAIYVHDEISLYVYGLVGKALRVPLLWHVHMREGSGVARWLRDNLCAGKVFVARFMIGTGQRRPWVLIRNPVVVREPLGADRGSSPFALRLGMIGSISPLKNQELALRVLARLRAEGQDATLSVCGDVLDADYRRHLDQVVEECGLKHAVSWRGFVPVDDALAAVDCVITCSRHESFGLATLEALSAGLPVVASDIPAHREIISTLGADAMTLAPLSVDGFVGAIGRAAAMPDAARRIGDAYGPARFSADIRRFVPQLLQASAPGDLREAS